ncbi:MAG: signal peptidase II [Akkermansia muciniphila]|nr:signal peptidase II [Akkermansia muciniphila]
MGETNTKTRLSLALLLTVLLLYALDQATKWSIVCCFNPPQWGLFLDSVPVVDDCSWIGFSIVRVHNQGVAFGFGNGTAWAPFVFFGVQVLALVLLVVLLRRGFFNTRLLRAAWALIMTGVLGNMTDRLLQGFFLPGAEKLSFVQNLTNGYVVDFLDVWFPWITSENWPGGYHWPAFNVADACVCVSALLFLIASFMPEKKAPAEAQPEESAQPKEDA